MEHHHAARGAGASPGRLCGEPKDSERRDGKQETAAEHGLGNSCITLRSKLTELRLQDKLEGGIKNEIGKAEGPCRATCR
eukprot:8464607-Alexandrium_andersonii.AAC.1